VIGLALVAVLVYAPPSGKAAGDRAQAEAALASAVGGSPLVGVDAVVAAAQKARTEGWVPEARLAFFGEAKRLADEGARALERVDLARGAELYGQAEAIFERELGWPGAAARLADAALQRGVALFELKRSDEAKKEWRRAVGLDSGAQLTEARVRPDVVKAFHEAVAGGVARVELPAAPAEDDLTATLPAARAAAQLGDWLGVTDTYAAAIALDRGLPTFVVRRISAAGCTSATVTVSAATFDAAARTAVERLRGSEEKCPAAEEPLADAEPIAHPRPVEASLSTGAKRRPLRVYESPWLWSGVVAGAALVVGLAVGLTPRSTSVEAHVDGSAFSPSR
jgi:hypothetical protein